MSKSLKNFTTIREALSQSASPRSLRISFLLGNWQDGIELGEELFKTATAWEGRMNSFFFRCKDVAENPAFIEALSGETTDDTISKNQKLLDALESAKANLDAALCDSFNTPLAMRVLSDLVTETNLLGLANNTLLSTARWITRIVTIFGLDPKGDLNTERIGWSGIDIPSVAQPYIYPASKLRDSVRQLALSSSLDNIAILKFADAIDIPVAEPDIAESSKPYQRVLEQFRDDVKRYAGTEASSKDFLALCDQLRDTHLWKVGIYLEDRNPPLPAMVRPIDKSLLEARAEQEAAAAEKLQARQRRDAEETAKKRLLSDQAKIDPSQMFRTEEFTEWDKDGIPLKDKEGDISKNRRKRLIKEWEKQKKLHESSSKTGSNASLRTR